MSSFLKGYLTGIFVMTIICISINYAFSQPLHTHGTDVPDWYDPQCCNQQDCRPVPQEDVDYVLTPEGPGVLYKPTGYIFLSKYGKVKASQDERYHVCLRYDDNQVPLAHYCAYIPGGV